MAKSIYYVYVLKSEKLDIMYKGLTGNLERRLTEHNKGFNRSTKHGIPWKLIYFERLETREEARKREKYLKSGAGREFIKKK